MLCIISLIIYVYICIYVEKKRERERERVKWIKVEKGEGEGQINKKERKKQILVNKFEKKNIEVTSGWWNEDIVYILACYIDNQIIY